MGAKADLDQLIRRYNVIHGMSGKKPEGKQKDEGHAKDERQANFHTQTQRRRSAALSVFPTSVGKLSKEECAKLAFKPGGMADTIIQALQKHGTDPGEKRKQVLTQVKAKFGDTHDATIRTQVYRGMVYRRALTAKPAGE